MCIHPYSFNVYHFMYTIRNRKGRYQILRNMPCGNHKKCISSQCIVIKINGGIRDLVKWRIPLFDQIHFVNWGTPLSDQKSMIYRK